MAAVFCTKQMFFAVFDAEVPVWAVFNSPFSWGRFPDSLPRGGPSMFATYYIQIPDFGVEDSRCTVAHYMQESLTWISCSSTFRVTRCVVERFHASQLFLKPRVQIPHPCAQVFISH